MPLCIKDISCSCPSLSSCSCKLSLKLPLPALNCAPKNIWKKAKVFFTMVLIFIAVAGLFVPGIVGLIIQLCSPATEHENIAVYQDPNFRLKLVNVSTSSVAPVTNVSAIQANSMLFNGTTVSSGLYPPLSPTANPSVRPVTEFAVNQQIPTPVLTSKPISPTTESTDYDEDYFVNKRKRKALTHKLSIQPKRT